jgi:hypothetical protein
MLARDHFEERRGLIEADLIRAIRPETVDPARLSFANQELASNITAVLALGDMKYLGTDIDWVKGLLANHDLPVESLREYLSLYLEYAEQHMDGRAEPIVDWLQSVTRDNGFGGVEGGG